MGIQSLFPTQIYHARALSPRSILFKDLIHECDVIRKEDRQGAHWSKLNYARGYTSYGSVDRLHELSPNFHELGVLLKTHLKKYLKALRIDAGPRDLRLTRMWMNHMGEGCTHSGHIHPLSVVSGTVYLRLPPGASPLKFEDPRLGLFMGRPPMQASAPRALQTHVSLQPTEGDVALFESWIRHEIPPNAAKRPRLSVSFNFDW